MVGRDCLSYRSNVLLFLHFHLGLWLFDLLLNFQVFRFHDICVLDPDTPIVSRDTLVHKLSTVGPDRVDNLLGLYKVALITELLQKLKQGI